MTPRAHSPLPSHLARASFRTSDTEFHGLGRGRLTGRDLQRPYAGVRSVGLDLDSVRGRCRAYEPLLREGEAFSHATAAILHGLPLPSTFRASPIHLLAPPGMTRARSGGVVGHESATAFAVELLDGLPVVAAPLAWCQVASALDRNDLVACGDAIVSAVRQGTGRRPAFASIDELRAAVLAWGTRRGASALRWAIERVRTGVDSRPETLTRLLLVAAGLPEPEIAPPVSLLDGRIVHPDLAYPALRIAFEYEGDEHRADVRRWRSDIRRREDLEDCGWRVVRITWDDLTFERDAFIARVRRLVASRVRTAD